MKKLLFAFALISTVGIGLYSCNNGAYDAHPDSDLSAALNPISSDSNGVTTYLGSMEAILDKKERLFAPAFYYQIENTYYLVARVKDDSVLDRVLRVTFPDYGGAKEYIVHADTAQPIVTFSMIDTNRVDKAGRPIVNSYTANTQKGKGYATINIQGEEGGHLRGYFFGNLFKTLPEEDLEKSVEFEYSAFYFEKIPFPIPDEYKPFVIEEHRANPEEGK